MWGNGPFLEVGLIYQKTNKIQSKFLAKEVILGNRWKGACQFVYDPQSEDIRLKSSVGGKKRFLLSAPTSPHLKIVLIGEDYGLKVSMRKNKGRALSDPASTLLPLTSTQMVCITVSKALP